MKAFICLLLGIFVGAIFADPICGRAQILENRYVKNAASARVAYQSTTSCDAEFYYDSSAVKTRDTEHFRIFYVLEGIHATTEIFVDSLANSLEKAWTYYIQKIGYRAPQGKKKTYHFQKENNSLLYPVEVVDITSMRSNQFLFGGFIECYALTYSFEENLDETEIVFENDFIFASAQSPHLMDTDSHCTFYLANQPMINSVTQKNYAEEFGPILRATAFHEFYHAIQTAYIAEEYQTSYWIEASATAQEEIGAPDVNDYWAYLPSFFSSMQKSFNQNQFPYGIAVWELYNENFYGNRIGKNFWERYSKNQTALFEDIFAAELQSKKIDPDSAFDDFAKRLFFSGSRAVYDSSLRFTEDAPRWKSTPKILPTKIDTVSLTPPAIAYYRITSDSFPDLENFRGRASVALYGESKPVQFYSLDTITAIQLATKIDNSENAVLILSRLHEESQTPIVHNSLPMRSYPSPWRGDTPLCFAKLPENKHFIEIRTRTGKLAKKQEYTGTHFCIEAEELRHFAPGLYYFRAGNHGKLKPMIFNF